MLAEFGFRYKRVRVIALCFLMCVCVAGCIGEPATFSLAPSQKESEISQEEMEKLSEILKAAPEAPDGVSFYAYEPVKLEDGSLKLYGFVRNKTGEDIYNIFGTFIVEAENEKIASADFNLYEEQFGILENGDSRPWTLVYRKNQILLPFDELDDYSVKVDVSYDIIQN